MGLVLRLSGVGAEIFEAQGQGSTFYEVQIGRGKHAKFRIRVYPIIREVKMVTLFNRVRSYLITAAVAGGLAAASFLVPGASALAAEEVVILGLWPTSGPYADTGPTLDMGARIALDEVGYKIAGKKIKYINRDKSHFRNCKRHSHNRIEGIGVGV